MPRLSLRRLGWLPVPALLLAFVSAPAGAAGTLDSTSWDIAPNGDVILHVTDTAGADIYSAEVTEAGAPLESPVYEGQTDGAGHLDVERVTNDGQPHWYQVSDNGSSSVPIHVLPRPTTLSLPLPARLGYLDALAIRPQILKTATGTNNNLANGMLKLLTRPHGSSNDFTQVQQRHVGYGDVEAFSPLHLSASTDLKMTFVSDDMNAADVELPARAVTVLQSVQQTLDPTVVPPDGLVTMTTKIRPAAAGDQVRLQRRVSGGWKTVSRRTVNAEGRVAWNMRPPRAGTFDYRVASTGTSTLAGNASTTHRLLVTKTGLGSASDYKFLQRYNGYPIAWSNCRTIHYRVRTTSAPTGALAMAKEAVRRLHNVTGYTFHYDGKTDFIPKSGAHQRTPLVIAWAKPRQSDYLSQKFEVFGDVVLGTRAGYGGFADFDVVRGHAVARKAYALMNSKEPFRVGFGPGETVGEILLHELGHAMGLGHVKQRTSPAQMMRPTVVKARSALYGAGDLHGLHILSRQGCF